MRFLTVILLFVFHFSNCQISIEGQVTNKQTTLPIEFANIYAKGTLKGTLSNQNGNFILNKISKKDTLVISAIGYEELEVTNLSTNAQFALQPIVYELNEVIIPSGTPVIKEYGFSPKKIKKKNLTTLSHGLIWDGQNVSNTAAQAARHIRNPEHQIGFIQSVSFFIHKIGRPVAPFRVRIIEMKANNKPGRELITDNLIVQARDGDIWLEINIADRQIEFPSNGFLVSMEWLQTNNKDFWYETSFKKMMKNNPVYETGQDKNRNRNTFYGYGQVVGLYNLKKENNRCWRTDIQTDWYSFINKSGELMIKAKVKVWE